MVLVQKLATYLSFALVIACVSGVTDKATGITFKPRLPSGLGAIGAGVRKKGPIKASK